MRAINWMCSDNMSIDVFEDLIYKIIYWLISLCYGCDDTSR